MSGANGNLEPIRAALDNPQDAPALARAGDPGPELGARDDGGTQYERPPFPRDCPVQPLGTHSDIAGTQKCFYLNWNGQLVSLEANNKHGKLGLVHLFGPASDWLEAHFPQYSAPVREQQNGKWVVVREPQIIGFDQAKAARALIEECVRRGIFDPAGKMRGAGAHRQMDGGLTLHCGDALLVSRYYSTTGELRDRRWIEPGVHDGHVYTAAAQLPRPHHEPAHPVVAEKLLKVLLTWQWKRPLLDARLVLGGIGASMIGGYLRWRPNIWVTGGRGTGKSMLNGDDGLLDGLFGTGQFRTSNASAAAIRQTLKNSTVPVMFDELEPGTDNNRRQIEVIELARIASSGGKQHRGGQDQVAHEFTLRSVFWFSSILIPPLQPQDRSRLAILELRPLPQGAVPPDLEAMNLPDMGRQLMRRMVDGVDRLEATKIKFHAALAALGHVPRACDQFGTLLACADLLINDHDTADGLPDDEEVAFWADKCRPDRMAEIADEDPDHVECLRFLLTSEVQARGGDEKVALGSWVGDALNFVMTPLLAEGLRGDEKADKRLQQLGLKLVNVVWKHAEGGKPARWGTKAFDFDEPGYLAIANKHQALQRLFTGQEGGKQWQGGVWSRSLGRFEGAIERVDMKFGHGKSRAVLVPLWQVLDEDELPNASKRKAAEAWLEEQKSGGAE